MKIFVLVMLSLSTLLVGCDRDALDGLNLKINADIKSSYDKEAEEIKKDQSSEKTDKTPSEMVENLTKTVQKTIETKKEEISNSEVANKKSVGSSNTENDPDAPIPFKEITECSKAGITAKTNEIFYADNSHLKSIDSKNEQQLKQWKKIYSEVEKNCN
ncbi:hypothetical protein ACN4EE_15055 [Geminocystis sp. CENA526]|uniref:hypothetical protein n=1 Tax=Geminocystis sp. CENA526 TaxID=1355871 RepID=UPI003D6EF994